MSGEPVPGSLFIYAPNKEAPIFFAVAFGISTVGHIWQCLIYKSFKLVGLHPVCGAMFTLGYVLREIGAYNYIYSRQNLIIFILSQVFIYVCPPLLELANYHVLGRVFYYVPHLAPLPPGRVLRVFGGLMAIVELLNALGVALAANPSSSQATQTLGKDLTISAIAIQLVIIMAFAVMAGIFQWRCRRTGVRTTTVTTPLHTLYASMGLIFIRCIYRLVEHTGNTTVKLKDVEALKTLSPILRYEWFFYVFEATLMLINSVLWNLWHPGRYLRRSRNVHLAPDGRTEVVGEEEVDNRSWVYKVLNVLTFGIFFRQSGTPKIRKRSGSGVFEELTEFGPATSATRGH
ncbi:putative RTA1 domain protein [Naviculisporaceae sp. PSN 640]